MRAIKVVPALLVLAACTAQPAATQRAAEPVNLNFNKPGATPVSIHQGCQGAAVQQCPATYTIRCEAYIRSFTRACMINNRVDPGYIALLAP